MSWRRELGEQIKTARSRAGLSQSDLAADLSVSRVQLGNYENGKSAIPVNILTEIAKALGVDFTVFGYKITPDTGLEKAIVPPSQQLSFAFGQEYRFENASVKITRANSEGGVVITALFGEPRSA